jgi:N-acetyl-anhydromuramyl-L-alanine amidase AmpD
MLLIDKNGCIIDSKIKNSISAMIEHNAMMTVSGIIVHQTGGSTADSSLSSYKNKGANGAHFLIDKDGTIYQTASIYKQTWHVGKLKSRCMLEKTCSKAETKLNNTYNPSKENEREQKKPHPDRFPSNQDSIGIELVGEANKDDIYVTVTDAQNSSLKWLIDQLELTLGIRSTEVFRHPTVSRKNLTEASTAQW